MEKFRNLSKGKKAGVFAIGLVLLVVLGMVVGTLMGGKTKDVVLSKENLTGLVETAYTVDSLKESEDGKNLEIAIKGDLDKSEVENLVKSLNEKNLKSGWNKEQIAVNVFASDATPTEKTDFFVEGLSYRVVLNAEKTNADISTYTTVPAVEKTDSLVDYSNGKVQSNDGNVVLSLDMDLPKDDEKVADVVQQLKTFTILFRETNSDKEIKSMELRVNPNDNERKYNFNTNYENVLEVIDVLPL